MKKRFEKKLGLNKETIVNLVEQKGVKGGGTTTPVISYENSCYPDSECPACGNTKYSYGCIVTETCDAC